MGNPACEICGKPKRLFGTTWKCVTSPGDHKKITDSLSKGGHGGPPKGKFAGKPFRPPKKKKT